MKRIYWTVLGSLVVAVVALGCDKDVDTALGPQLSPLSAKDKGCPESGHPSCGTDSGNAPTFHVTISSTSGTWTDGPQQVQSADKVDWLHVFDSGGKGTRGNPNYANAAFSTSISLQPADIGTCLAGGDPGLWVQFNQALNTVVFDFQTDYDIGDPGQEDGPSFFLFRWEEPDGRVFSVGTGFDENNQGPSIDFLGDNDDPKDDIRDATIARTFSISGGAVIVKEMRRNRVIATLACPNDQEFVVTVAP